eukprot:CAMPEP_0206466222 /NCGR_PEP_ID=MMETSP0324_2-20121206/28326_1 /ASSEMBLY_ACC=CAM_ASM_000836 /TAXON_ID=2866 /ORGANISM="Crypthecodinium cohnii, Strain Seligo" /LENGTH=356 /DNA_ID=CAMNT_0053939289 /DNA_START=54 /DNA_END=1126 /DNA_ORIENTATION=-
MTTTAKASCRWTAMPDAMQESQEEQEEEQKEPSSSLSSNRQSHSFAATRAQASRQQSHNKATNDLKSGLPKLDEDEEEGLLPQRSSSSNFTESLCLRIRSGSCGDADGLPASAERGDEIWRATGVNEVRRLGPSGTISSGSFRAFPALPLPLPKVEIPILDPEFPEEFPTLDPTLLGFEAQTFRPQQQLSRGRSLTVRSTTARSSSTQEDEPGDFDPHLVDPTSRSNLARPASSPPLSNPRSAASPTMAATAKKGGVVELDGPPDETVAAEAPPGAAKFNGQGGLAKPLFQGGHRSTAPTTLNEDDFFPGVRMHPHRENAESCVEQPIASQHHHPLVELRVVLATDRDGCSEYPHP